MWGLALAAADQHPFLAQDYAFDLRILGAAIIWTDRAVTAAGARMVSSSSHLFREP
ncbi:hypothetical protein CHELA1G11_21217 [Hyphomicrobiales bacterium]|nr:hypothetical protein CHELA1G11_21217 [Hyphomicrobiales bacterium]CAH1693788.1 hypothetical protein CHELA1G2_21523 [Hyphomicrobiales bacterium]